jgi:signal transduction histidine kinase
MRDVLPLLVKEMEVASILLKLVNTKNNRLQLTEHLLSDIARDAMCVFKSDRNGIRIRNAIYFQILINHKDILEAIQFQNQKIQHQEENMRDMLQLTISMGMAKSEDQAFYKVLGRIRNVTQSDDVLLLENDERIRGFRFLGSANHKVEGGDDMILYGDYEHIVETLCVTQGRIICQQAGKLCLDTCIQKDGYACSWISLRGKNNRPLGALVLKGQTLINSPLTEQKLLELGIILATSFQRRHRFRDLRRLSEIRFDFPLTQVMQEICEVACALLNKPVAMLWFGNKEWPPFSLQWVVGAEISELANFEFTPPGNFYPCEDHAKPIILSASSNDREILPIPRRAMLEMGLHNLLFVCFPMHNKEIGVLGIGSLDDWQPTEEEKTLALLVTKQAAITLDNIRSYTQKQHDLENSEIAVTVLPHELKNKPRAIGGEVEILLDKKTGELSQVQRKAIMKIERHLEDHEQIIDRILDITRLDCNLYQTNMKVHSIRNMLNDVLETLAVEVQEAGMRMVTEIPSVLPKHRIDPYIITQIMENLIRNAIQYGKYGTVAVRAIEKGGKTEICVEDEGPGVAAEYADRIFEKWHRGSLSKSLATKTGNLGLGLYFVRQMMELLGGRVFYDKSYTNGARFVLIFPALEGGES